MAGRQTPQALVRVLLTSIGSYGDLNPYIGLGRALVARGHHVMLAVPRFYQSQVEAAGLECRPLSADGDPDDREVIARIMDPFLGADYLVRRLIMPRIREMYDDLHEASRDADALVSHPLTFAAPVVAEKRGLPWAGAVLAPLNFFSKADPPVVVPSPVATWLHRKSPGFSRVTLTAGRLFTRSWGHPVRDLRRSLGLPDAAHPVYEGQFSPHLNLALFSSVLAEPQIDWPVNTVVTGAVRWDNVQGGMPEDLDRFLDQGDAPIVFTLGSAAVSVKLAPHFFDVSVEAARQLGRRAVLLVGRSPENRPAIHSDQAFVAEWAPHSELFPRAAALVHQGGAGTLHTALSAGRPMVIVPFAHDQPDNAMRAERLGVARTIYPQHYTAARVRDTLTELLADVDMCRRAAETADIVCAEQGADRAAEMIESRLR